MALVLVALFVLVPLALLLNDLVRGGGKPAPFSGPSHASAIGVEGQTTRGPRPRWPTRTDEEKEPGRSFRPTGRRRDFFGDVTPDRTA